MKMAFSCNHASFDTNGALINQYRINLHSHSSLREFIMNHHYRVIWNHAINAYIVVSEKTKACGKRSVKVALTTVLSGLILSMATPASAITLPSQYATQAQQAANKAETHEGKAKDSAKEAEKSANKAEQHEGKAKDSAKEAEKSANKAEQ
ncbi:MAG: hypothetical protein KA214_09385, partial [Neisseriaceae bacterium]|nr:hypothetical protein [Neisseriaceae bacterium]